jgi:hypothetical protein
VLIYKNIDDLQNHLDGLSNFGTQLNMKINTNKTEVMTISRGRLITNITINGYQLKLLEELKYLGSMITYNNKQAAEIGVNAAKQVKS